MRPTTPVLPLYMLTQSSKRTLLFVSFLLTATLTYAQDNIVLKNGNEINAKVLEVSPTQIKYRRQDNPDGPIYTTGRADILLIKYANGTKDILTATPNNGSITSTESSKSLDRLRYHARFFSSYYSTESGQRLFTEQVRSAFASNSTALHLFEQGQSFRRWGYITGGAALVLVGVGIGTSVDGRGRERNNNTQTSLSEPDRKGEGRGIGYAVVGGGVLLGVAAVVFEHQATMRFRRAAKQFNNRPTTSMLLMPSQQGVGLRLLF